MSKLLYLHQIFTNCVSKRKAPEDWESYFCIDLTAGKVFCMYMCMYVCVYVCMCIPTCGTQVGILNNMVQFEDGLCGSHKDFQETQQKYNYIKI